MYITLRRGVTRARSTCCTSQSLARVSTKADFLAGGKPYSRYELVGGGADVNCCKEDTTCTYVTHDIYMLVCLFCQLVYNEWHVFTALLKCNA